MKFAFFVALCCAQNLVVQYPESPNPLQIADDQYPRSFYLTLDKQPASPVTVLLNAPTELRVSACSLNFDQNNWDVPQQVAIDTEPVYRKQGTSNVRGTINAYVIGPSGKSTVNINYNRTISYAQYCVYSGDPHLTTFDSVANANMVIDNQNPGYYWLVNNEDLKIQVQHYPCNKPGIFCNLAVAIQYLDELIILSPEEFYQTSRQQPYILTLPGKTYKHLSVVQTTPKQSSSSIDIQAYLNGFKLLETNLNTPIATNSIGYPRGYINLKVYLPARFRDQISGLCGNYDGDFNVSNEFPCDPSNPKKVILPQLNKYKVDDCFNLFFLQKPLTTATQPSPADVFGFKKCTVQVSKTKAYTLTERYRSNPFCCNSTGPTCAKDLEGSISYVGMCGYLDDFDTQYGPTVDVSQCSDFDNGFGGKLVDGNYLLCTDLTLMKRDDVKPDFPNCQSLTTLYKREVSEQLVLDPAIVVNSPQFINPLNLTEDVQNQIASLCNLTISDADPCRAILGDEVFQNVIAECQADASASYDPDTNSHEEQPQEKFALLLQRCQSEVQSLQVNQAVAAQIDVTTTMEQAADNMAQQGVPIQPDIQNIANNQSLQARSGMTILDLTTQISAFFGFGDHHCKNGCFHNKGQGICTPSGCVCEAGFKGLDCSKRTKMTKKAKCPNACNAEKKQGHCTTSGCVCKQGWRGFDCGSRSKNIKPASCPSNCHADKKHGRCTKKGCVCAKGWRGWDCGTKGKKPKTQ